MCPAVSVVTATYNHGHYLGCALDSVLGQTFQDFEVVVVDDGSTDDTPSVIEPYLRDARVRYEHTDHLGQPGAENTGVRLSRAPLVAFCDADDAWLPAKLDRQVALFRALPETGIVYSRRLLIDPEGYVLETRQPPLYRGVVLEEMFRRNFVCFSSSMVKRSVFDKVGGFDDRALGPSDYDFWLRAASHFRFDYVDEPLILYRTGHASLSSGSERMLLTALQVMDRFLDEHGGREALDPRLVRQSYTETYAHLGLAIRSRSRIAALPWYLRALARSPGYRGAWKGIASLLLPEAGRRFLRRASGRPANWKTPQRLENAMPVTSGLVNSCGQPRTEAGAKS